MNKNELLNYITSTYNVEGEYPFDNDHVAFRHLIGRKIFALFLDVPESKFGLKGDRIIKIVNVKCNPFMIGDFLQKEGFFPAYHMNKTHWLSIDIERASENEIKLLIDFSYLLTEKKIKGERVDF